MTSQIGQQPITVQMLHNISRSKDNHAMKCGQLIEEKANNIFLQKFSRK